MPVTDTEMPAPTPAFLLLPVPAALASHRKSAAVEAVIESAPSPRVTLFTELSIHASVFADATRMLTEPPMPISPPEKPAVPAAAALKVAVSALRESPSETVSAFLMYALLVTLATLTTTAAPTENVLAPACPLPVPFWIPGTKTAVTVRAAPSAMVAGSFAE